ncbi:MAG: hypothetical protein EOS71_27740 [Mesorhizobium sp.]|nr:MAG: hypothetical protein EOS71_27740 [Mesorhizobium sp.]
MPAQMPSAVVSVAEAGGEWHVIIERNSHEPVTRSFDNEQSATSYAEDQRVRLGLVSVTRV